MRRLVEEGALAGLRGGVAAGPLLAHPLQPFLEGPARLAGVLEPSLGTVHLGGVSTKRIRRFLARWVVQDDLTDAQRQTLVDYYAGELKKLKARGNSESIDFKYRRIAYMLMTLPAYQLA